MSPEDRAKSKFLNKHSAAQPTPVQPQSQLAAFLITVNRITGRLQSEAALKDMGIAIPDWLLLRAVKDATPLSMAAAARRIGVSRQRVHQQATKLQAVGLLTTSSGEDDKTRQLTLSAAGDALLERAETSLLGALSRDGKVPANEIESARRAAGRVAKILIPKKNGDRESDE